MNHMPLNLRPYIERLPRFTCGLHTQLKTYVNEILVSGQSLYHEGDGLISLGID